jgi:hypothetical protein
MARNTSYSICERGEEENKNKFCSIALKIYGTFAAAMTNPACVASHLRQRITNFLLDVCLPNRLPLSSSIIIRGESGDIEPA